MRIKYLLLATLIPALLLTASCAVEPKSETHASQDRVMQAWMRHNYPGKTTYGDTGLYVLEHGIRVTVLAIGDSAYVFAHYVKSRLDGEIISTNDEGLARQLGTYSVSEPLRQQHLAESTRATCPKTWRRYCVP